MSLSPGDKTSNVDTTTPKKRMGVFVVFAILVVVKAALWLSIEKWPDIAGKQIGAGSEDAVVKIGGLPVWFMVYWPDSGRYWTLPKEGQDLNLAYILIQSFFAMIRLINDSFAFAVLALNIVGLLTAWLLFRMLSNRGIAFIGAVLLIAFLNLFTISMEYSIMREVLARFFLILGVYLVWRVRYSESRILILLASSVLLCLGFVREEMMIYPLVMATVFFSKKTRKTAILFIIIGLFSIYISNTFLPHDSGKAQLNQNLILESYNYDSPELGDLPRKIYEAGKKCESAYLIKCQLPSIRHIVVEGEKKKIINEWMEKFPKHPIVVANIEDVLNRRREKNTQLSFMSNVKDVQSQTKYSDEIWNEVLSRYSVIIWEDTLKYNKKYIFYSVAYSLWSYFTGNLYTFSPFVYWGVNPNFILGWPSYSSASLTSFGDPLSELSLIPGERRSTWLTALLAPFSEKWYRPICAPFFFMGLCCIAGMIFFNKLNMTEKEKTFWFLAASICITGLAVASLVGTRTSRTIFIIDPLMVAISVLGARMFWHITARRLISSNKGS